MWQFSCIIKQQEIVMTAKYPSARRRLPASAHTLSFLLALGATPAFAAEASADGAGDSVSRSGIGKSSSWMLGAATCTSR